MICLCTADSAGLTQIGNVCVLSDRIMTLVHNSNINNNCWQSHDAIYHSPVLVGSCVPGLFLFLFLFCLWYAECTLLIT